MPGAMQKAARDVLSTNVAPDWIMRKLRHSFLYHPDRFEEIYFDNFYCAFPESQHSALFTRRCLDELQGVDPYAGSMKFFSPAGKASLLNHLLYLDVKTYLVELLMKQDQMSMAASIESRVPFLDHKLVEFAASLPARLKIRRFNGKYILRRAMEDRLPHEIIHRTKKGFPTPIQPWLRGPLFEKLSRVLSDGRLAERKIVRQEFVDSLLQEHRGGSARATDGCWRLLTFELWNRIFLDRDPAVFTTGSSRDERTVLCA